MARSDPTAAAKRLTLPSVADTEILSTVVSALDDMFQKSKRYRAEGRPGCLYSGDEVITTLRTLISRRKPGTFTYEGVRLP